MNDKLLMKDYQCLMIKTKDKRKFFTHEKNYVQLIEFSKVFDAEVSVVKVKEAEILDLPDLAPAICTSNCQEPVDYQILEIKISQAQKKRKDILKHADRIKKYIRIKFMSGVVVSLKELTAKFNKYNVTVACLCNHLTQVRKQLESCNVKIVKVGGGKYKME